MHAVKWFPPTCTLYYHPKLSFWNLDLTKKLNIGNSGVCACIDSDFCESIYFRLPPLEQAAKIPFGTQSSIWGSLWKTIKLIVKCVLSLRHQMSSASNWKSYLCNAWHFWLIFFWIHLLKYDTVIKGNIRHCKCIR